MSKDTILLSPKHGLNPSLALCFYCGEAKGVVIPGRMKDDAEAPRQAVWDMDPCDSCAKCMKRGIIFIQVADWSSGSEPYRTGPWVVLKEEAARRLITEPMLSDLLKRRCCFMRKSDWELVIPPDAMDIGNAHDNVT